MRTTVYQRIAGAVLAAVLCAPAVQAADLNTTALSLDRGYGLMYNLEFTQARQVFTEWQKQNPADPMGPVSEAAGLLFAELDRLGVLEAQFYEDDHKFEARKKLTPDPTLKDAFLAKLGDAEARAQARLKTNPKDRDALLGMTLSAGLKADYFALIEKSNLSALHYTKEATNWANQVLAVDPECYDAKLAIGISQYIIGSMAAPVRWVLRLGGVSGDKKAGIADLEVTAQKGRYLAPFARILLAIAYVREKDTARARELLSGLRQQFPGNPLFAREIARLESAH